MAFSYVTYSGNGSQYTFAVPFPFLKKNDVSATVDGTPVAFTWAGNSSITILPAPAAGAYNIKIKRTTSLVTPAVDFTNGSSLKAGDLDKMSLQTLYLAQELQDGIDSGSGGGGGSGGDGGTATINVKAFGAKGDGVTDDSAAFKGAMDYIVANLRSSNPQNLFFLGDYKRPAYKLYVPAGDYLITKNFTWSNGIERVAGLIVEGDGMFSSNIIFKPDAGSDKYFWRNDCSVNSRGFAWMMVRDLGFHGVGTNACLFNSTSVGATQNIKWQNCMFEDLKYCFYLDGSDTNSEMGWADCTMSGEMLAFLRIPDTGSDQFLNYWFTNTTFHTNRGALVEADKGGCFVVHGGSFIHTETWDDTENNIPPSYYFKLRTVAHADGTPSLQVRGVRFETRGDASRLFWCNWGGGNILFDGCNTSPISYLLPDGLELWYQDIGNLAGPHITFRNCELIGHGNIEYGITAASDHAHVRIEQCGFVTHSDPKDWMVYTPKLYAGEPHINQGGAPLVEFHNCKGKGVETTGSATFHLFDYTANWHHAQSGVVNKRVLRLAGAVGQAPMEPLPDDNWEAILPPNAAIVSCTIQYDAGVYSSYNPDSGLKITLDDGTELHRATMANHALGQYSKKEMFVKTGTNVARRRVKIEPIDIDQEPIDVYCLIEYLA